MCVNIDKYEFLQRISYHLITSVGFINEIGLYHGKMGIAIFFANYSIFMNNKIYNEIAIEILDDIIKNINKETPVNFESGLCGIGFGIEYLLENKFIFGNSDEILQEIDKKILETDLTKFSNYSTRTGLRGFIYYIEKRIKSNTGNKKRKLVYCNEYLSMINHIKTKTKINSINDNDLLFRIYNNKPTDNNINNWPIGIENGCAGFALKKILTNK